MSLADVGIVMAWTRRSVYNAIAKRLTQDFGTRVHLYVATEAEAEGLRGSDNESHWASIQCWNVLSRGISEPDLDETLVVSRANKFEIRLSETINRLTFSHRQFGRGHSPGSFHYPRAPRFERATYLQMVHGYNESLTFWEKEIIEKGLQLIIDGDKLVSAVTRMMDISYRRMIGSRYKNYWFWTPDEYQKNPKLESTFRELKEWNLAEVTEGYLISAARSTHYFKRIAIPNILRRSFLAFMNALWWRLRGYERANYFGFWNFVMLPFGERRRYLKTRRIAKVKIDELGDLPFVFFPLHKEPETSFLTRSPDFTNQHAAIMAVARDLPAGIRLVVKENLLSIGARPSTFLPQLADMKNVVLLDVHESGIEAIRRCVFVATITGTVGLEAASIGKPVLTFTPHVTYEFLNHVKFVGGYGDLRPAIEWALSLKGTDLEKSRQDGGRFLESLKQTSFDMGEYGATLSVNQSAFDNVSKDTIDVVYKALLRSLSVDRLEQEEPEKGSD